MLKNDNIKSFKPWLHLFAGLTMLITFFLPWVKWEGSLVSGYSMPSGEFFQLAESTSGLGNPFPEFDFTLLAFWLIPVFVIIAIAAVWLNKRSLIFTGIAGMLSLSLVTVFILFTRILITLGTGNDLGEMVFPWLYLQAAAAFLFIASHPSSSGVKKTLWILAGPVFAFSTFTFIENYLGNKTHTDTIHVKADYTVNSDGLIREFVTNDSAANKKYFEKVIIVNGPAFAVEIQADSTSTIRFADSTGSYAIFSLGKSELAEVQKLSTGSAVSIKGVCSGSIFSEILGTTSISFKRAILNNKK